MADTSRLSDRRAPSLGSLEDMQAERQAWAEFEHRDGFYSGFVCGVGFTVVVLLTVLFAVGFFR